MQMCDGRGETTAPHQEIVYEDQGGGCPLCLTRGALRNVEDRLSKTKAYLLAAVEATETGP